MTTDETRRNTKELRAFGLTLGGMAALVFGLALPWLFGRPYPVWPWILSGALLSAALVLPGALRPVFRVWMTIGHWLGWINTRIILGILFYTVFLLAGVIMKLMGKDPMARKFDSTAVSYRVHSPQRSRTHVERPF